MITGSNENSVERSADIGQENTFTIAANAKAFRILSDGLYSDKITSIIRELSCNAYDAHIAANNTEPFLIHLPNDFEPFFSIRDYGIGLSKEDIQTIYTQYFMSTKTASNAFIGCLGLGSKSPFCYTDNFNVISYYNGMKYNYTAFINESGFPSITLMNEEATTEKNGMEIVIGVKPNDFYEFVRRIPKIFQYFTIKPIFVGGVVEHIVTELIFEKADWNIRKHTGYARAIQGNVCYPLNDYSANDLTPSEKSVLDLSIDIFFPIGQLEVSASREKLSYNAQTMKNIKAKLASVATEIMGEISNKLNTCTSLWEARKMVYNLHRGDYERFSNIIKHYHTDLTWNGIKVFENNKSIEYIELAPLLTTPTTEGKCVFSRYESNASYRRGQSQIVDNVTCIPITNHTYFYIKDIRKNLVPRCQKILDDIRTQDIANNKFNQRAIHIILINELTPDGIKEFKAHIGMLESDVIPLASTLPFDEQAVAAAKAINPKNACSILKWNITCMQSNMGSVYSKYWESVTVDITKDYIYVPIDRYMVNGNNPFTYIEKYTKVLKFLNIPVPEIYGVKAREQDKIKSLANWVTLANFTQKHLTEYSKVNSFNEQYGNHKEFERIKNNMDYPKRNLLHKLNLYGKPYFNHRIEFVTFTEFCEKTDNEIGCITNIIRMYEQFNITTALDYDNVAINKKIEKMINDVLNLLTEYPMMNFVHTFDVEPHEQAILIDYIKTIDNNNLLKNAIKP